jgi:hypothetical protein
MQRPSTSALALVFVPLTLAIGTLAGCAATPTPTAEPTASETTAPTVEPTTPVVTETFSMPADCTEILPPSTIAGFEDSGIIALAGPGGKYGNELITEPTPEMDAGGISCYFGVDNEDPNLLTVNYLISAVSLDSAARAEVIADLSAQGLSEATDERGDVSFGILGGGQGQSTANYNVIAADSWISVISSFGGEDAFLAAVELANDVHVANYN